MIRSLTAARHQAPTRTGGTMHLPIDPRTGITALGILPSGRVVWPIRGGAEDEPDAPAQEPTDPPAEPTPADPPKDETDWKAQARKWEDRAKANAAAAKKLDDLEAANATELEKAQKIAEESANRAKTATERAVKAEVKALATGFQDPIDAFGRLGDLSRFVSDDGEIDEKAIAKELADILKNNEHLAKREDKPEPTRPGARPTEKLRPGAAPAEPERAGDLYDAIGAWAQSQT